MSARVAHSSAPPAFWLGILTIIFKYFRLIAPFDEVAERDGRSRGQPFFLAGGRRQAHRQDRLGLFAGRCETAPPQVEHDSVAQVAHRLYMQEAGFAGTPFFLSRAYQYDSICFRISEGIYERSHFYSRQICSSAFSAKWTVHALRLNFHRPIIHNFFPDIRAVAFDFSMLAMTFKHLRHQWCWWFSDSLIRENLSLDK
jgi:hypothetical protein